MGTAQKLFGKKVRMIRRSSEMTQEQLAELSGLSLQYIGEIERGRRNPSLASIEMLSSAFDLPISELFNIEEFSFTSEKLRQLLINKIELADEEQLRKFYSIFQSLCR